jgi:hypothetical protein
MSCPLPYPSCWLQFLCGLLSHPGDEINRFLWNVGTLLYKPQDKMEVSVVTGLSATHSTDGCVLPSERVLKDIAKNGVTYGTCLKLKWHVGWTGNSKFFPVHAMKTPSNTGGIAPLSLNLSTRWRLVVTFTLLPPYPQETTGTGIEWVGLRAGMYFWRREMSLASTGIRTRNLSADRPVTVPSTVSRMSGPTGQSWRVVLRNKEGQ